MPHRAAVPLILALLALFPRPASGASQRPDGGAPTCDRRGTTLTVHVPAGAYIFRSSDGSIGLRGFPCDGGTVTTVDKIKVVGDTSANSVTIQLGKGFKPGATDEPGSSDEIEFQILLGGDPAIDSITILGDPSAAPVQSNIRVGGFGVGLINLNAGEATGIDSDLSFTPVEKLRVSGADAGDTLSAHGGAGTSAPYASAIQIDGYGGNDTIAGGAAGDLLYGGDAADTLAGNGAGDTLTGGPGSDDLFGNSGDDTLKAKDMVTGETVNGGNDTDTCVADAADIVSSCE